MTTASIFIIFYLFSWLRGGNTFLLIYLSSLLIATPPKERIKSAPCLQPKPFENGPFGQRDCTTNLSTDYQLINCGVLMCPKGLYNGIFSNCPYRPRQMPVSPQWKRPTVLTLTAPSDALTCLTQCRMQFGASDFFCFFCWGVFVHHIMILFEQILTTENETTDWFNDNEFLLLLPL